MKTFFNFCFFSNYKTKYSNHFLLCCMLVQDCPKHNLRHAFRTPPLAVILCWTFRIFHVLFAFLGLFPLQCYILFLDRSQNCFAEVIKVQTVPTNGLRLPVSELGTQQQVSYRRKQKSRFTCTKLNALCKPAGQSMSKVFLLGKLPVWQGTFNKQNVNHSTPDCAPRGKNQSFSVPFLRRTRTRQDFSAFRVRKWKENSARKTSSKAVQAKAQPSFGRPSGAK